MGSIHLQIHEGLKRQASFSSDGEVECGRQDPKQGDPEPYELIDVGDGRARLVIIPARQTNYSRKWFVVSCDDRGHIHIRNLHREHDLKIANGRRITSGESESFPGPVTIDLGQSRAMRVAADADKNVSMLPGNHRLLDSLPMVPGRSDDIGATMTLGQFARPDAMAVVDLLKIALSVVQQASGSGSFFQAAAHAATVIVGLDRAAVLIRERPTQNDAGGHTDADGDRRDHKPGTEDTDYNRPESDHGTETDHNLDPRLLAGEDKKLGAGLDVEAGGSSWSMAAEFLDERIGQSSKRRISRTLLDRVVADRRTQIHDPEHRSFDAAHSVTNVHSIVASPVLDANGEVIAVLYGDRWTGRTGGVDQCISDLEGTLVEVLAGAVAGGIARQEEERQRNVLSGFFSPRVASLLATQPDLLLGRDATVTVLFCDVRGFSNVTEHIGPRKTIEWINDVFTDLSRCVVDRDGGLVDYVGDELMAMWGAPDEQPAHAELAVRAAVAMLEAIEVLRERWAERLPQKFGAGIGINTGTARVGNVGSDFKFKYGVLGNTVNGGSRLQAATKQLGVNCLASEQSVNDGQARDCARRLAQLQVVGIDQPIHVYEIAHNPDASWSQLRQEYEAALTDYEAERFGEATQRLGALIQHYPEDRPSRMLLTKAVTQIDQPDKHFSPVWVLTRK